MQCQHWNTFNNLNSNADIFAALPQIILSYTLTKILQVFRLIDTSIFSYRLTVMVSLDVLSAIARSDLQVLQEIQRAACTQLTADAFLLSEIIQRYNEKEKTELDMQERNRAAGGHKNVLPAEEQETEQQPAFQQSSVSPSKCKKIDNMYFSNVASTVPVKTLTGIRQTTRAQRTPETQIHKGTSPLSTSKETSPIQKDGTLGTSRKTKTGKECNVLSIHKPTETISPTLTSIECSKVVPSTSNQERSSQNADLEAQMSSCIPKHGINSWSWELGVHYTLMLANMCENGVTADIRKAALLGSNEDVGNVRLRQLNNMGESAGLLDLLAFQGVGGTLFHFMNHLSLSCL